MKLHSFVAAHCSAPVSGSGSVTTVRWKLSRLERGRGRGWNRSSSFTLTEEDGWTDLIDCKGPPLCSARERAVQRTAGLRL